MVSLKIRLNDDIRRISVEKEASFPDLIQQIRKLYHISSSEDIVIKYLDDEGDKVTLSSDMELKEALQFKEPIQFFVFAQPGSKQSTQSLQKEDDSIKVVEQKKRIEEERSRLEQVKAETEERKKKLIEAEMKMKEEEEERKKVQMERRMREEEEERKRIEAKRLEDLKKAEEERKIEEKRRAEERSRLEQVKAEMEERKKKLMEAEMKMKEEEEQRKREEEAEAKKKLMKRMAEEQLRLEEEFKRREEERIRIIKLEEAKRKEEEMKIIEEQKKEEAKRREEEMKKIQEARKKELIEEERKKNLERVFLNDNTKQVHPKVEAAWVQYRARNGRLVFLDLSSAATARYKVRTYQRVNTPAGPGTVVGVDQEHGYLWFHLDKDKNEGLSFWDDIKDYDSMICKGIVLTDKTALVNFIPLPKSSETLLASINNPQEKEMMLKAVQESLLDETQKDIQKYYMSLQK